MFATNRILYIEGDDCVQAYDIKEKKIEWDCVTVNFIKHWNFFGILPNSSSWFVAAQNLTNLNLTTWNFYDGPDLKKQYIFEIVPELGLIFRGFWNSFLQF